VGRVWPRRSGGGRPLNSVVSHHEMAFAPEQSVVILGTSRRDGNTRIAVERIVAGRAVEIVDLSRVEFSAYDYTHQNAQDGFIPLIESLAKKQLWILATPVYWYTMSAQLKVFLDRLSDLITIRKDLGRLLRGKSLAVVTSGTDASLPQGFESPFSLTCEYLGMKYVGVFYSRFEKSDQPFPGSEAEAGKVGTSWIL
jgi:multimeric flavodoxin WrbA